MKTQRTMPSKVSRDRVRSHFQEVYSLSREQVEIMLKSSAQSLTTFLSALEDAVDNGRSLPEIARLGHGLKGVLLNMGEEGWAEVARNLESSAAAGKSMDYGEIVAAIRLGVDAVLEESGL